MVPKTSMLTAENDIRVWKRVVADKEMKRWTGVFGYNTKTFPFGRVCEESGARRFSPDVVPKTVGAGFFHAFMDYDGAAGMIEPVPLKVVPGFRRFVLAECTIPAGAKYFLGNEYFGYKGIVSNKIIVHKPKTI